MGPTHLQAPPRRPRETAQERADRQFDVLRELTEHNMVAARDATHQIVVRAEERADAGPASASGDDDAPTPAAADPTLALARATRSVVMVVNLERRLAAGEAAPAPANDDPRGLALRRLLHPLANGEPDPIRRRALRQRLNDGIDDALGADLDDGISLGDIAVVVARRNGLHLDPAKVPDCYLLPISDPACLDPTARITPIYPQPTGSPSPYPPGD